FRRLRGQKAIELEIVGVVGTALGRKWGHRGTFRVRRTMPDPPHDVARRARARVAAVGAPPGYPQIARAAATTTPRLAPSPVSARGLPAALLAKPHCGLIASRSSSICLLASSTRRRNASMPSSAGSLLLMSPSTTPLPLGTKRNGAKSPARGVSYSSRKWL